jgi:hypothetical protein
MSELMNLFVKAVNDTILTVYPIRIASDKTDICKILFSLGNRI